MPEPNPPRETEFPLLKDDSAPDVSEAGRASAAPPEPPPPHPTLADRMAEKSPASRRVDARALKRSTRRDFLLFGVGAAAALAGLWWTLPEETQQGLGDKAATSTPRKERVLNEALSFDDDVAEALYSPHRLVPTYSKSQITPNLINNYNGATPDPGYLDGWRVAVAGLASGKTLRLDIGDLLRQFNHHEQITRLVCVEGWSAIAWWGGLRFADFLEAFPPAPGARWARLDSSVNLDSDGNPDPYFVSIDLPTARHPQTLLATHHNGKPLTVDYGAPLRLIAPMKLGLKNIKAITGITYTALQPADYWAERGYSKYDGV